MKRLRPSGRKLRLLVVSSWFVVFLLLLFLLTTTNYQLPTIHAQTSDELTQQLQQKQDEINKIEAQLAAAKKQETTLKTQLEIIDTQTKVTELKIEETALKIAKLEREIDDLSNRIERISANVDKLTQVLLERIVKTYKYSSISTFDLILSSQNFGEMVSRVKYIQVAQENDKKVLYQLQATKDSYNEQRQDKEKRQAEAEQLNVDLGKYNDQLAQQKQAKEELLRVTKNDEIKFQSLIAQLRADTDSIRRALGGAGVKLGPVKRGDTIASVGNSGCSTGPHLHYEVMANARVENNTVIGKENKVDPKPFIDSEQFAKPIEAYTGSEGSGHGAITTRFGEQYFLGTHHGLDIAAYSGTPIKAAADGVAYQFSDSATCYLTGTIGKGIVLDHDNSDYVTLYWHIP